jgi:hypothetical protein
LTEKLSQLYDIPFEQLTRTTISDTESLPLFVPGNLRSQ